MLRLVGFFFAVFVLLEVLRRVLAPVPIVGALFNVPILGFWVTAILLSMLLSKIAADALDRRKRASLIRQLGAVDTPHNMGKLGALFSSQGHAKRALPYLEKATEGEPEVAEWQFRLGTSQLELGNTNEALEALDRAVAIDEEYAYGSAMMRKVEAHAKDGEHGRALDALERYERNHGPNPESAYRRGVSLKGLGRKDDARAAFEEVSHHARSGAKYQRKSGAQWVMRAFFARMG